jgi:predicted amidohydrolase YtcJ
MDPSHPRAEVVAIGGGRLLAVGSNDDMRGWVTGGVVVRDLAGHTLLPGFYDSHNHMLITGLNMAAVGLADARSVADVVRANGRKSCQRAARSVGC